MGIIRSRKERLAEETEHPGQSKYKIFWKDTSGIKHTVEEFWAKSDKEAKSELDVYVKKIQLIDPNDSKQYFYGSVGNIVLDRGNGMEETFDDFNDSMKSDETIFEKIKFFFMRPVWRFRDIKYMFKDFWYWFKHYDVTTNKSHQRCESWNLDSAVLDMLEFNIPIILRDKGGVPGEFCTRARKQAHADDAGFDVNESFRQNPNSSESELKRAELMWNAELETVLRHIRLYRYYSDFGIIDDKDKIYVEIENKYKNTIPYKPGTDKQLDYHALHTLIQTEWNAIWDWWKQYGQMCWT